MAVTQEFQIVLTAKDGTSTTFKAVGEGTKEAVKGFESLEGKLVSVHAALDLAKEAFSAIKEKIDELSAAYRAHEASTKLFAKAMEYSGNYTAKSATALKAYAEQLQKLTGIDKTTTLGLMAQAKAIGLTDEQTKKAISASANLAAARGMDIGAAFEKVMGTLHGATDGLKDMVPALRHVNTEALATGKGFDLIEAQFKGAAAEGGQTWDAYTKRASAAKEDIIADIGEVIDKGLDLTGMAKSSAEFWEKAAEKIGEFKATGIAALTAIREGFKGIDWLSIGKDMQVVAGILVVAFGPALLSTLGAAAVSVAAFAATWVAVPIGVAASVLAIDLVVKNMERLPELAQMFGEIFERSLLNVRMIFDQLLLVISVKLTELIQSLPGGDKLFGGLTSGLAKFSVTLSDAVDVDAKKFDDLGKAIGGTWATLDQGLAGKLINQLQGMGANVEAVFAKVKAAQEGAKEAGKNKGEGERATGVEHIPETVGMAERAMRGLIGAGKQAAIEAAKIGMTEADAVRQEMEMQVKEADKAHDLLKSYGKLDSAQDKAYSAAKTQLAAATAAKITEINRLAALEGAKLYHGALDDDMQAVKTQLDEQTMALDQAARRDLAHFEEYQKAKQKLADKAFDEMVEKATLGEKLSLGAGKAKEAGGNIAGAVQSAGKGDFGGAITQFGASIKELKQAFTAFASAAKDIYDNTIGAFVEATQFLVQNVLNGKWVQQLGDAFNTLGNLPNEMLQAFQQLDTILARLMQNLPSMLQNFLNQLPSLLQKIMAMIPQVVKEIADMLPKIAQAFADAAPGMIKALMDAMPALIDGIIGAMLKLMDKVPEMFERLLEGLPNIIKHLIAGIGEIVSKMLQQLPVLVDELAKNIAPIISQLIESIIDAMPQIIGAFIKMLPGLVAAIVKLILNVVVGVLQGIARGLADLFSGKGFKFKMPDEITNLPKNIASGLTTALDTIRKSGGDLFKVEDFKSAAKSTDIGDRIRDAAASGAAEIASTLSSYWKQFVQMIKDAFNWVWMTFFQPIVNLVQKAWSWVEDHIVSPLVSIGQKAFQWVEDHIVGPLAKVGQEVWGWVDDHIVTPLQKIGQPVWQWIEDHIISPLAKVGQPIWQWIYDNIVKPLQSVGNIFSGFKLPQWKWPDFPSFQWPAINFQWPGIPKPSWWNLSSGGPVGGLVNNLGKSITNSGVGQAVAKAPGSSQASGAYHKVLGHEKGGPILYADSGTLVQGTDTVPAMLTPGEYVVNRQAVGRVGTAALDTINSGNMPGGGSVTIAPVLNITTTQPVDPAFVRSKLVPAVMDAIKQASQNGKYVLSSAGIRNV